MHIEIDKTWHFFWCIEPWININWNSSDCSSVPGLRLKHDTVSTLNSWDLDQYLPRNHCIPRSQDTTGKVAWDNVRMRLVEIIWLAQVSALVAVGVWTLISGHKLLATGSRHNPGNRLSQDNANQAHKTWTEIFSPACSIFFSDCDVTAECHVACLNHQLCTI